MNRSEKTQVVAELNKEFLESQGVVLVQFQNITVPQITELRRKIRENGSRYRVVKNTLALRAAEDTPIAQIREHFAGATAIATSRENSVGMARALRDFIRDHPGMSFRVGVLEGSVVSARQVEELADLPPREALLAKLLFLLNAPLSRFAGALQSPLRNLAAALQQIADRKE